MSGLPFCTYWYYKASGHDFRHCPSIQRDRSNGTFCSQSSQHYWRHQNNQSQNYPPLIKYGNQHQNPQMNLVHVPIQNSQLPQVDCYRFIGMLNSSSISRLSSTNNTNPNIKIFYINSGANWFCVVEESMLTESRCDAALVHTASPIFSF